MYRTLSNSIRNYQQYLLVPALMVLLLLSSCPVKASIKRLAAEPIPTEQRSSAQANMQSGHVERCALSELAAQPVQSSSSQAFKLIPALLFAAVAFLFFGPFYGKTNTQPLYGRKRTPPPIPLYLQYRKLKLFI